MSQRTGWQHWIPAPVVSLAIAIALLSVWEVAARNGMISPLLAPAPSNVVTTLVASSSTPEILRNLLATAYRVSAGLLIGGSAGVILGLAMGSYRRLRAIVDPFVSAIYPLPKIAIFPVVMAALGIGDTSRITVISLAAFFPMMISTMNGVLQISPVHLDVARNYGASGNKLFRRVILPGSLPMVMNGLRLALNSVLHVTIAIEIASATIGLGSLIWVAWEVLRMNLLYATLIVIALLGIALNAGVKLLSALLVPWSVERDA